MRLPTGPSGTRSGPAFRPAPQEITAYFSDFRPANYYYQDGRRLSRSSAPMASAHFFLQADYSHFASILPFLFWRLRRRTQSTHIVHYCRCRAIFISFSMIFHGDKPPAFRLPRIVSSARRLLAALPVPSCRRLQPNADAISRA